MRVADWCAKACEEGLASLRAKVGGERVFSWQRVQRHNDASCVLVRVFPLRELEDCINVTILRHMTVSTMRHWWRLSPATQTPACRWDVLRIHITFFFSHKSGHSYSNFSHTCSLDGQPLCAMCRPGVARLRVYFAPCVQTRQLIERLCPSRRTPSHPSCQRRRELVWGVIQLKCALQRRWWSTGTLRWVPIAAVMLCWSLLLLTMVPLLCLPPPCFITLRSLFVQSLPRLSCPSTRETLFSSCPTSWKFI